MEGGHSAFLGSGFPFPLRPGPQGTFVPPDPEEDIRQSVYLIVMTRQGERPMHPDFGCRIWDYVFEVTDNTTLRLMEQEVRDSVTRWERRVEEVEAEIEDGGGRGGKLFITVSYVIRGTNHPGNLVFPFYLNEGQW